MLKFIDRIMSLPILRIFHPFYKKHQEGLLYLFFGVLSVLVNLLAYMLFEKIPGLNPLFINLLAWVVQVLFAFWTNSNWVFQAKAENLKGKLKQLFSFSLGRLFSLFVEEGIIFVFITKMGLWAMAVKFFSQLVVAILNYLFSKLIVFKKKGENYVH